MAKNVTSKQSTVKNGRNSIPKPKQTNKKSSSKKSNSTRASKTSQKQSQLVVKMEDDESNATNHVSNSNQKHGDLILNSREKNQATSTKVVSSNPTLNFLLSTPINGPSSTIRTSANVTTETSTNTPTKKSALKRLISNSSSDFSQPSQQQKSTHKRSKTTASATTANNQIASKSVSYLDEIRKMMHSFGDVQQPSIDSARMIESIVQHQMILLLYEAERVAREQRQSRTIGVEDFLFLLRHDCHKMAKLIRHLNLRDMKLKVLLSVLSSEEKCQKSTSKKSTISKSTLDSLSNDFHKTEVMSNDPQLNGDTISKKSSSSFESSSTVNDCTTSKRIKICREFIGSILSTPQNSDDIKRLFDWDFVDNYTFIRNRRLNEFTQTLSVRDYLYFQSCRSMTFFGPSTLAQTVSPSMFHRFQDWLLNEPNHQLRHCLELRPNELGWEVLQYFAHETVGILVELALMVKRDQSSERVSGHHRTLYSNSVECERLPLINFRQSTNTTKMNFGMKNYCSGKIKGDPMLNRIYSSCGQQSLKNKQDMTDQHVSSIESVSDRKSMNIGISPDHVLEALRRFELNFNVFNRFARCHGWTFSHNRCKRILCLSC